MSGGGGITFDIWNTAAAVVEATEGMGGGYADLHTEAIASAIAAERERCAAACEKEAQGFLSPEYAYNQPLGSFLERFACDECAAVIRKGDA